MPSEDDAGTEAITLNFGELEARLARLHEVASEKRTQFQARLRNFQRLGVPHGVGSGRGRAVAYRPGQVVEMALALEFTQLGLLPERVERIFIANRFPVFMAVRMAARELLEKGGFRPDRERLDENSPQNTGHWWVTHDEEEDPMSMFLFFDPTALASLTDIPEKYEDQASATFFYGGPGMIRDNIVRWTAGPFVRRLSLVNVTAVIWSLVVRTKPDRQTQFIKEVVEWADEQEELYFVDTVASQLEEYGDKTKVVEISTPADVVEHAELIRNLKGLPRPVADMMVKRAEQMIETGKVPGEDAGLSGKPMREMTEVEFEEEVIGQLTLGGLPEMVARSAIEGSREDRRERRKQAAKKKPKSKRRSEHGDG